jgi:hypothetical protein
MEEGSIIEISKVNVFINSTTEMISLLVEYRNSQHPELLLRSL